MTDEEKKVFKAGLPYVWAMIQTLLIMKVVILYFGNEMSVDPSPQKVIFFVLALMFSFGSLIFFAYRKHKNDTPDEH